MSQIIGQLQQTTKRQRTLIMGQNQRMIIICKPITETVLMVMGLNY